MPQSDVPGEKTSPTQPFPTKPAPFDRQGVSLDDLIDFTPELNAEAIKMASDYKLGPLFTPPIVAGADGKRALLALPNLTGGANWQGGAVDRETGMLYVASGTSVAQMSLNPANVGPDPARISEQPPPPATPGGRGGGAAGADGGAQGRGEGGGAAGAAAQPPRMFGPQGLPLIQPPYGRITAIDLNTGDHVWMVPNGKRRIGSRTIRPSKG